MNKDTQLLFEAYSNIQEGKPFGIGSVEDGLRAAGNTVKSVGQAAQKTVGTALGEVGDVGAKAAQTVKDISQGKLKSSGASRAGEKLMSYIPIFSQIKGVLDAAQGQDDTSKIETLEAAVAEIAAKFDNLVATLKELETVKRST
jgi:hypothetical protein